MRAVWQRYTSALSVPQWLQQTFPQLLVFSSRLEFSLLFSSLLVSPPTFFTSCLLSLFTSFPFSFHLVVSSFLQTPLTSCLILFNLFPCPIFLSLLMSHRVFFSHIIVLSYSLFSACLLFLPQFFLSFLLVSLPPFLFSANLIFSYHLFSPVLILFCFLLLLSAWLASHLTVSL